MKFLSLKPFTIWPLHSVQLEWLAVVTCLWLLYLHHLAWPGCMRVSFHVPVLYTRLLLMKPGARIWSGTGRSLWSRCRASSSPRLCVLVVTWSVCALFHLFWKTKSTPSVTTVCHLFIHDVSLPLLFASLRHPLPLLVLSDHFSVTVCSEISMMHYAESNP